MRYEYVLQLFRDEIDKDLKYLDKFFDLKYSSGLCHIGFTRDLLHSHIKIRDFMGYYSESVDDLNYVGAVKTLVPSIEIGGDDVLFEVGLIISTPHGTLFPATLFWRRGSLVLGGMQEKYFHKFQGFQDLELVDINFTDMQLNELAEALELALKKVPITDFEGKYWNDEYGEIRMGIKSGVPFTEDIEEEINEDFDSNYTIMGNGAARYYYSEFEEIIKDCITTKDMDEYNEEIKRLIKVGRPKEERMIYHNRFDGKLINRCYDELIHSVNKFNSRFAFHALGVIILNCGAKMTHDIKIQILENSHWNDERHKFKNRDARIERKKYLFDFIIKIIEYKEGELIRIPRIPRENFKKDL